MEFAERLVTFSHVLLWFSSRLKSRVQKMTSELDRSNNANRAQVDRINCLEREVEAGRIAATAGKGLLLRTHLYRKKSKFVVQNIPMF